MNIGTRKLSVIILFVLSISTVLLCSALVIHSQNSHSQEHITQDLREDVDRTKMLILNRLQTYTNGVYAVRALFATTPTVTRVQYRDFIESMKILRNYPGLASFGYSKRVSASEKANFIAAVRQDTSTNPNGFPSFQIYPESARDEYMVLTFVEPMLGNEAALGFDLSSNPARVQAFQEARDTNREVLSQSVVGVLRSSTKDTVLVTVPVYAQGQSTQTTDDRRKAFKGIINAGIRTRDFFESVFPNTPVETNKRIQVFEGNTTDDVHLLYDSHKESTVHVSKQNTLSDTLTFGGRTWTVQISLIGR